MTRDGWAQPRSARYPSKSGRYGGHAGAGVDQDRIAPAHQVRVRAGPGHEAGVQAEHAAHERGRCGRLGKIRIDPAHEPPPGPGALPAHDTPRKRRLMSSSAASSRRRAMVHNLALAHDVHAVGHAEGQGDILLDEQDAEPFALQAHQHAADLAHDDRRQTLGGLVEEEELRIGHQGARHGQHLLLAARERAPALLRRARAGAGRPRRRAPGSSRSRRAGPRASGSR